MKVVATINPTRAHTSNGGTVGIVELHLDGCNHTRRNHEQVGTYNTDQPGTFPTAPTADTGVTGTMPATLDNFAAYTVSILDGSLDNLDGHIAYPWKSRKAPCLRTALTKATR